LSSINIDSRVPYGANPRPDGGWEFVVWAPKHETLSLRLFGAHERSIGMARDRWGYHQVLVTDLEPESRYVYRFGDSREFPDPASRFQPEGVHGPSEIVDLGAFQWTDSDWEAPRLEETIFYEVHVGTYSQEGTLDRLGDHLPELADLGVTTIELMPVAQFPGSRNWGYDGVYPFAVQNSYGGPLALQRFVNSAHANGLAVTLDVVYNHIGPEGNYLSQYGPYFTEKYRTPWGPALNFDGSQSGPVRRFFIENALYWFENFHIDVLRLDAIHGIFDFGALHFLAELEREVEVAAKQLRRNLCLVAESDLNDARVLLPPEKGGYGLPAQWSDDFHHSLHTLLTGERDGYYVDFGSLNHLATVLRDGWFYQGNYSEFRRRRHGNSPRGISASHHVVCSQNHDQTGNRALGERLSTLIGFEGQKLAAGMTLLSPFVPLLFMGEEYAETSPFQYFTSHGDQELVEAVRRGRRDEFSEFGWKDAIPDPHEETTFTKSVLHHNLRDSEPHRTMLAFYHKLIAFRRANHLGAESDWVVKEIESLNTLTVFRRAPGPNLLMIFNFSPDEVAVPGAIPEGHWTAELNSAGALSTEDGIPRTIGPEDTLNLRGHSFVVFKREEGD
jgi:maltooligosyltrehalose trehalohydrolase